MKFSDIAPVLIEKLPFHSLMRCSTEAGERPHYMNMMYYYSHTLCGGGKERPDVLKKIFKWQWRTLWYCIMSGPQPIASAFKAWVAGRLSNKANEVHDDAAGATMENDEDGGVVRDSTPLTGCTSFWLAVGDDFWKMRLKENIRTMHGKTATNLPDERNTFENMLYNC